MAQDELPGDSVPQEPPSSGASRVDPAEPAPAPPVTGESDAAPVTGETDAPRDQWRTARIVGLSVLGALVGLYLIAVLSTVGGVPDNTTVAGVDIGGMTQEEATAALETGLAEQAVEPITMTALDQETVLAPQDAGLQPDYAATADAASGPIFNPATLLKIFTGQTVEVAPVVGYDEAQMTAAMANVAATSDQPAVEPAIAMDAAKPTLTPGSTGQGVDQQAAVGVITAEYLATSDPIPLPTMELAPTVTDEEAQKVLQEYATPAVSGPVKVAVDTNSEQLGVDTIAAALSFNPENGTLVPQLNIETVRAGLPKLAAAEDPGTSATWDVSSGTPVVVPSKQGKGVTDEDLSTSITEALPKTDPAQRVAELTIVPIDPALTTEQAQALNITEQMSSFTQKFDYAEYREVNVGQAAKYMNGTVLKPGDVYSMNGTIKERTEANGYVEGTFISNGRFEQGLGGGVSIATTATWTAAFFAGLEAVEVNPHSLYISRYQPGLEATVAWGQLDLRFRNDSGNGVLITTESGGTFITVTMWGTKKYSDIQDVSSERYDINPYPTAYDTASDCSSQGGVDGFTIDVWRVFYQNGAEVKREKFTTDYDPTTKVVCAPPPAPSPSATAG